MDYLVVEPNVDGNDGAEFAVVEWAALKAYRSGEQAVLKVVDRRPTDAEAQVLARELTEQTLSGPGV